MEIGKKAVPEVLSKWVTKLMGLHGQMDKAMEL